MNDKQGNIHRHIQKKKKSSRKKSTKLRADYLKNKIDKLLVILTKKKKRERRHE